MRKNSQKPRPVIVTFLWILSIIFLVEALVMLAIENVSFNFAGPPLEANWIYAAVDAVTLVAVAGPLIWLLAIRPYAQRAREFEDAVSANERRLNAAQRIAKLGAWELNLKDGALYWTDEVFRIFELDPERFEPSYEAFLDVIHSDDREKVNAAYQQSLRDRLPHAIDHRLKMADGSIKWVHEQCETEFDAHGAPLVSRGTVQDITSMRERADGKSRHRRRSPGDIGRGDRPGG